MNKPRPASRRARWNVFPGAALALLTLTGVAQERFPGTEPSGRTEKIQEKAERAYQAGDYERAFRIWRKDLVEIGDKYAQYMVGYMYLTGEGVEQDSPRAYAWYRLAAERGHDPLVGALRDLETRLSATELEAGMAEYEEIAGKYGDRQLVRRLIRLDELRLKKRTGRVGASVGGPLTVVHRSGRTIDGTAYYDAVEERLERRYAYLQGYVEFGELEMIPDELDEESDREDDGAGNEQ